MYNSKESPKEYCSSYYINDIGEHMANYYIHQYTRTDNDEITEDSWSDYEFYNTFSYYNSSSNEFSI